MRKDIFDTREKIYFLFLDTGSLKVVHFPGLFVAYDVWLFMTLYELFINVLLLYYETSHFKNWLKGDMFWKNKKNNQPKQPNHQHNPNQESFIPS